MTRRTLASIASLAAVVAVASLPAHADDAAEARFFDELGRRAYARGRWEDALEAFLDAHAAAPSPRTLYNVALAAQLAHREALAFSSFETYLDEGDDPDTARRADATSRRDALAHGLALVHVVSEPEGATVFVDRRALGSFGRTPRTLVLEPGPHAIEIASPDHETAHFDVTATRGERQARRVVLAPHVGTLRVEVTPATATLSLVRGEGEPRELAAGGETTLPVGAWTLHASLAGHRTQSIDLTVARDRAERRVISLAALPTPTGRLLVSTDGVHARLSVDGAARAETPARLDAIDVGTHRVRLEADGYVTWSGELEVRDGRATHLAVTLVRAP